MSNEELIARAERLITTGKIFNLVREKEIKKIISDLITALRASEAVILEVNKQKKPKNTAKILKFGTISPNEGGGLAFDGFSIDAAGGGIPTALYAAIINYFLDEIYKTKHSYLGQGGPQLLVNDKITPPVEGE